MGNSLQDYRCKIGTFSNNKGSGKYKSYVQKFMKKKSSKFEPTFLLMFSLICILTLSIEQNVLPHKLQSIKIGTCRNSSEDWLQRSVEIVNANFESRYVQVWKQAKEWSQNNALECWGEAPCK